MESARARIAMVSLVLAAALPAYAQPKPAAGSKEALVVVDKLINALGGRKALESIEDTTISATAEIIQFGLTVPVTIYQKEPDKIRTDVTIAEANMTIVQAFDGATGWMTNPQTGSPEEMPDFMVREVARQASQNQALLYPQKLNVSYALKPKATIEGKDYIVLEQTRADGHKTTIYLDPASYLPYKTQTRSLDLNGAEVDSESYATDYQKVGGTIVPFSLRIVQNGADAERLTITAVAYNTALDDALFRLK